MTVTETLERPSGTKAPNIEVGKPSTVINLREIELALEALDLSSANIDKINSQVIRAAFLKKAKPLHPDKPTGDKEAFARLQAAYDTIIRNLESARPLFKKRDADVMAYLASKQWSQPSVTPRPVVAPQPRPTVARKPAQPKTHVAPAASPVVQTAEAPAVVKSPEKLNALLNSLIDKAMARIQPGQTAGLDDLLDVLNALHAKGDKRWAPVIATMAKAKLSVGDAASTVITKPQIVTVADTVPQISAIDEVLEYALPVVGAIRIGHGTTKHKSLFAAAGAEISLHIRAARNLIHASKLFRALTATTIGVYAAAGVGLAALSIFAATGVSHHQAAAQIAPAAAYKAAAAEVSQPETVKATVMATSLHLRTGQNTHTPIIESLKQGAQVQIIGDIHKGWIEVKAPFRNSYARGYVRADYIS